VRGVLQLESDRTLAREGGGDPDGSVRWTVPPGERGTITAPRPIEAPNEVEAGKPFTATIHTIGQNGCWSAEGQNLTVEGNLAAVVPWDVHSGADVCTEVLGYLPHRVEITFTTPGRAVIRVDGRRARQGDRTWELPVSAEKEISVR
jgi:hypothetical protein